MAGAATPPPPDGCQNTETPPTVISLPDEPHQPKNYEFPKRSFGHTNPTMRAFQGSWFSKWPWLHYDASLDLAFCFTCAKTEEQGKLRSGNRDPSFLSKGFSNWKNGTESFKRHEKSKCHSEAVEVMVILPKATQNIADSLSAGVV